MKAFNIYLFFLTFTFLATNFVFASNVSRISKKAEFGTVNFNHAIGIGGTVFKTWGLAYRHQLDEKFGIVANAGFLVFSDWAALGIAPGLSYNLAKHKFNFVKFPDAYLRIYGIAYLAGIYERHRNKSTANTDLGLGLGPGAELFLFPNFSLHLELPWMSFIRFANSSVMFASSHPHIGGGLSYYF